MGVHDLREPARLHCTFAVTAAFPLSVKVQVFALFPALEHAPDQTASRPFVALRVIDVPVANDAEALLPTATLMPAGLDVTRSPLRPVAVTVTVAVRVTPPALAVIVTGVDVVTAFVAIAKDTLLAP